MLPFPRVRVRVRLTSLLSNVRDRALLVRASYWTREDVVTTNQRRRGVHPSTAATNELTILRLDVD